MAMLAGCGGGGGGSETAAPPPVAAVPQPAILFAGAVSAAAEGADAIGSMGGQIELDAGGSKDADGGALTFAWSIVSKPASSGLNMGAVATPKLNFQPDALGTYIFKVRVTNGKGGFAEKNATVLVNNRVPNAVVVVNATYTAQPLVKDAVSVSARSGIVLDATGSTDADGDKVSTTWELIQKPAGSSSTLFVAGQTARFSPDVLGLYKVRARGADGKGAYAETVYQFDVNNSMPLGVIQGTVAVVSRNNQTVPVGQPLVTSGILSYDEGGAQLTYAWAVDSRPAGSVAALASASTAIPSFTPDVAGAYMLSLTVSNGRQTAVAYLKFNAVIASYSVVDLPFTPQEVRYSKGLDRLVMISSDPDAMKITNPADGVTTSISLPTSVKSFNLSPDGKLAAVLHEGVVSLVDLVAVQLLRSTGTEGTQTEVFTTNDGVIFLMGQSVGMSTRSAIAVLNGRTGQVMPGLDFSPGFYGTLRGVFAASKNKAFAVQGTSYAISYFTVDPQTNAILANAYVYGDYPIGAPLFLSPKEDLLFTAAGTYFSTDTLKYVGRFILSSAGNTVLSMSYSPVKAEALLMETSYNYIYPVGDVTYQASYKRFTGDLLFPAGDVTLPVIGGEQSYGIGIFHTAAGDPVALVQTGGFQKNTPRVKYHLIYR
ncbi:PKD domain-containing protein [Janthinobacterium sp. MDB2-8]|uniref:PKD domain-containing protein n=1 Tax=Janthinobacterium sp. MDB2-8 TaxID=1259338 RepID=UPI003F1EE1B6